MDADGSNQQQLTFNDIDDMFPVWSPEGAQITFDSDRDGDFEIYVMDADGSNEQLTFNSSVDEYPAWSPDGAQIAFDSNRDGDHEIYVMDADGSNQQQLTFNDSDDGFPAWSPEGAQIAFTSNRDGDWEIYIMDADGNNEEQLTTNDIDDGYPAWSPRCEGAPADSEDVPSSPSKLCQIDSAFREYWEIALCETFDSETTLWTGDQEGTSARIEGGQYILDNSTKVQQGYTTGFIFPVFAGSSQDHMISVDGTMESIYQGCTWGVFIRSESNEIVYFFMINNSGRYSLTGSSDNESSRYLGNIDSGSNSAIVGDGTNTITAVADGKQMEFYVNGELIITHEAINSENPHFGLIVWGGEGVTAVNRFDNLLVRTK